MEEGNKDHPPAPLRRGKKFSSLMEKVKGQAKQCGEEFPFPMNSAFGSKDF